MPAEKNGMIAKSGKNIEFAVSSNEKAHKDPWNTGLRGRVIREFFDNKMGTRNWHQEYDDMFALHPENTFLVKLAYWLNR